MTDIARRRNEPKPCEFCGKPTNDLVVEVAKREYKYVCGVCLFRALEKILGYDPMRGLICG